MKPLSTQLVPAFSGFFVIYADDRDVIIGEPVIAWRISTFNAPGKDETFTQCDPITTDGDPGSNCIGIQHPDLRIESLDALYDSLDALKAARLQMTA